MDDYYRVKDALSTAGIRHQTKSFSPSGGSTGGDTNTNIYHVEVPESKVAEASRLANQL